MSDLPDSEVLAIVRRTGLPARTKHTITSADTLLADLGRIRAVGYAIDDGEQELGVRCIAAPVHGLPFRAAISVSGPSSRVTTDQAAVIAPAVLAAAEDLRTAFGI
jgi:IclR family acetate operon transcriptional repressor